MLNEQETAQAARSVADELDVDGYAGRPEATHHDQYAHHTHELSEDASEATTRALVRIVPLAYGVLLGVLADETLLGLAGGVALGAAFDLYMGENSIVRSLSRRARTQGCPAMAWTARALSVVIRRLGLPAPAALSEIRCRTARP